MGLSVEIEKALYNVLRETDLLSFQTKLAIEKQLTRLDHFQDVTDDELMSYGLSTPAVRRLRNAIERHQKQPKKGKLLGSKREKYVVVTAKSPKENDAEESLASSSQSASVSPYLIARDDIKLLENVGEGTFAIVKRAIWRRSGGQNRNCAVKILHDMSEQVKADLFAEISNMQKLQHQNLVHLYGVVFGDPTLMVIEFCDNGSLLDRLRSRTKERLLVTRLHNYAQQIANGMSYLESRHFIHRDLATRNVLLTDNEEVVKICDFGMTRPLSENERLYVMSGPKKVPFSWCPPESLRFRQFSHKSDVWAFGVTLWELYTYGEEPWIGYKAVDVLQATESGERLRAPTFCSMEVYNIMQMCWSSSADARPKFSHLRNLLQDIKFMIAVCRAGCSSIDEKSLELRRDEQVILISERNEDDWFGQSVTTRKFGTFPRSFVTLRSQRAPGQSSSHTNGSADGRTKAPSFLTESQNFFSKDTTSRTIIQHRREISNPIPGSFIHAGHGDTNETRSWGYVEKIDDIYLKNPILGINTNKSAPKRRTVSFVEEPVPSFIEEPAFSFDNSINNDYSLKIANVNRAETQNHHQRAISVTSDVGRTNGEFQFDESFLNSNVPKVNSNLSNDFQHISSTILSISSKATKIPPPNFSSNLNISDRNFIDSTFQMACTSSVKSLKYDSAISIPRPNRSSPIQRNDALSALRITPPPPSIPLMKSKTSVSSLPTAAAIQPISNGIDFSQFLASKNFSGMSKESPTSHLPDIGNVLEELSQKKDSTVEEDPFVVAEGVKSLAAKIRYNEVMQNNRLATAPNILPAIISAPNVSDNVPASTGRESPDIRDLVSLSSTSAASSSNYATVAPIPPPAQKRGVSARSQHHQTSAHDETCSSASNLQSSALSNGIGTKSSPSNLSISSTSAPTISLRNETNSLLPPPSQLLLTGVANNISISSDSGYFPNASFAFTKPTHLDFLESAQLMSNGFNDLSSRNSRHYQPIFAIGGHMNNALIESNGQRIRYGENGIPILEPMPTTISGPPKHSTTRIEENRKNIPVIDLQDLNTDNMIANVKKLVDFASEEQCRAALRRHGFDVEAAVRALKVEKLIEMGLAGDRHLAASALDSVQWNVNEAANRLL